MNATYKPFLVSSALFLLVAIVFLLGLAFVRSANLSPYVGAQWPFFHTSRRPYALRSWATLRVLMYGYNSLPSLAAWRRFLVS